MALPVGHITFLVAVIGKSKFFFVEISFKEATEKIVMQDRAASREKD